jgi:hypothetical protein
VSNVFNLITKIMIFRARKKNLLSEPNATLERTKRLFLLAYSGNGYARLLRVAISSDVSSKSNICKSSAKCSFFLL